MPKIADDGAEVFAGGYHPPTANRMEPHRDGALGQQRRRVLGNDRVRVVDAQREIRLAVGLALAVSALRLAGHELVRAQRMLRPEIARADAVAAAENARRFLWCD